MIHLCTEALFNPANNPCYAHLLLDEAQDTSEAQLALLERLAPQQGPLSQEKRQHVHAHSRNSSPLHGQWRMDLTRVWVDPSLSPHFLQVHSHA